MGKFLRGLGTVIGTLGVLSGFVLSLYVVYGIRGGAGLTLSLILFPLTFALTPFYTLISYGSWNLLLINYGSIITGLLLHHMADRIDARPETVETVDAPMAEQAFAVLSPDQNNSDSDGDGYQLTQWWNE